MFVESKIMHRYLDGLKGIEIGAGAHNPFGLDTLNVDYVQHSEETYSGREQKRICGKIAHVDIFADGCSIPVADKSFDFVISSHVFEHLYSPVHAIEDWMRIAKKYVALIVPDRFRCGEGDKKTTLADVVERFNTYDPNNPAHKEDKHWTHWTLESFLIFCDKFGYKVEEAHDRDDKVGNGFLVILKVS